MSKLWIQVHANLRATSTHSPQLEVHLRNQAILEGSLARRNQGHSRSWQENTEILHQGRARDEEKSPIHAPREGKRTTKSIKHDILRKISIGQNLCLLPTCRNTSISFGALFVFLALSPRFSQYTVLELVLLSLGIPAWHNEVGLVEWSF